MMGYAVGRVRKAFLACREEDHRREAQTEYRSGEGCQEADGRRQAAQARGGTDGPAWRSDNRRIYPGQEHGQGNRESEDARATVRRRRSGTGPAREPSDGAQVAFDLETQWLRASGADHFSTHTVAWKRCCQHRLDRRYAWVRPESSTGSRPILCASTHRPEYPGWPAHLC